MSISLHINGQPVTVEAEPDALLLWALRNDLGLTGTKFGCGAAQCGACMVLIDGEATPSCVTPLSAVAGREVTTIEGLAQDGGLHPLQQAWIEVQAPQCGYCQSGQLMSAVALLNQTPQPSDAEIREAMSRNLCRCGTYGRIFQAIKLAASRSEVSG